MDIIKQFRRVGYGKTGVLPPYLSVEEISEIVGFNPETNNSGDGKVKFQWSFLLDGHFCSIWDYKGAKWSTHDPNGNLKKLFKDAICLYPPSPRRENHDQAPNMYEIMKDANPHW